MKSHITWALVGASVVALGFSSIAATDAAWRASAPASGGMNLSTGLLDISLGIDDQVGGQVLADFGMEDMAGESAIAKPLEVFNSGNVPMNYVLDSVAVVPQAPAIEAPPLNLVITEVDNASGCNPGVDSGDIYDNVMDGAETTVERPIAAGESEILCLVASLGEGAKPGQAGTATFEFRALVDR